MVKGETAVIDQKRVKRLDKKKQALIGSQIKRKRMGFPACQEVGRPFARKALDKLDSPVKRAVSGI